MKARRRGAASPRAPRAQMCGSNSSPPAAGQPASSHSGASQADPIGDPATLSFLTMTTRPTLRTDFRAANGGKTAVYTVRWVNTQGEKGPWSDVTTATVAA